MATSGYKQFVSYVRRDLTRDGCDTRFVTVAAAYAEAVFYINAGIGTPAYNDQLAERKASKSPLSGDEKIRARAKVEELYTRYKSCDNISFRTPRNNRQKSASPTGNDGSVSLPPAYLSDVVTRDGIVKYAMDVLSREPQNARGQNWEDFKTYVCELLRGASLSRDGVQSKGINPDSVLEKAKTVARHWRVRGISSLAGGVKSTKRQN